MDENFSLHENLILQREEVRTLIEELQLKVNSYQQEIDRINQQNSTQNVSRYRKVLANLEITYQTVAKLENFHLDIESVLNIVSKYPNMLEKTASNPIYIKKMYLLQWNGCI